MISAILLAAGQSKRMIDENKLTKKLNGIPVINHSVNNILSSNIDELIVVLGYQKEIIEDIVEKNNKIKFTVNKNFTDGISTSIKTGLDHLSDKSDAFFICLGDMPLVNKKIYNHLIKFRSDNDIVIPIYKNQQANPILFSKNMKKNIMGITGDFAVADPLATKSFTKLLSKSITVKLNLFLNKLPASLPPTLPKPIKPIFIFPPL